MKQPSSGHCKGQRDTPTDKQQYVNIHRDREFTSEAFVSYLETLYEQLLYFWIVPVLAQVQLTVTL